MPGDLWPSAVLADNGARGRRSALRAWLLYGLVIIRCLLWPRSGATPTWPGRRAGRRADHRQGRVFNRCFDAAGEPPTRPARMLRLEQFLAQPVQPHDRGQRHRPGRCTARRTSGPCPRRFRCAGRVQGGNLSLMDYCTGLPSPAAASSRTQGRHRRQWLAAAMVRAQQRVRRVEQRGLEPGLHRRGQRAE